MDNNPILKETLSDMLGAGISYWADITKYEDDPDGHATVLELEDREDNDTHYRITTDEFYAAAETWAKEHFNDDYDFYQRFARSWVRRDWEDLDWDVRISDEILQVALFNEQRYA